MVSPLDIVVAHGREDIENFAGARSTIKDISYDMERVNRERMNKIRDNYDEIFGTSGLDDGINDSIVIGLAVVLLQIRFVEQFANDIFVSGGKKPAHFRTAVFDGHRACDINHLV